MSYRNDLPLAFARRHVRMSSRGHKFEERELQKCSGRTLSISLFEPANFIAQISISYKQRNSTTASNNSNQKETQTYIIKRTQRIRAK